MLIEFRATAGSTVATIHRGDGVVLELPGYDRAHRVPHDLAHVATERELQLPAGVFGLIASGAVFSNMRVTAGRPRHDARARSDRLLRSNRTTLTLAEVLAGVLHDAVERRADPDLVGAAARRAWATVDARPFPWTDRQLAGAVLALAGLADHYARTGTVRVDWPDRLTVDVPDAPGVRRGRRGRR